MSTINLSALKSITSGPPIMQSQNGVDRGKFCRAWVSFGKRLGDIDQYEIQSHFNVLAVEDTAAGQFTIQFKNAMPTNRFAIAGTASQIATQVMNVCLNASNTAAVPMTTTSVNIRTVVANTTDTDPNYVCVYAYGDT
tara:strand:+ start:462 stop:875 length:414 start_codon:yes stop_codon:yes gene_type:complete